MLTRITFSFFPVFFFILHSSPLVAEKVEIRFMGTVKEISGEDCFNGAIEVKQAVLGSYVYERDFDVCDEGDPLDCWGDGYEVYQWCSDPVEECGYYYSTTPNGMKVVHLKSGITFETDYTQDLYKAFFIALGAGDDQDIYQISSFCPVVNGGDLTPEVDPEYIGISLKDSDKQDEEWTVDPLPAEAPNLSIWDVYPDSEGQILVACNAGFMDIRFRLDTMVLVEENLLAQEIELAIWALDLPSDGVYDLLARFTTVLTKLDEQIPAILKTYQACNELQALLEQLEALEKRNRPAPAGVDELIGLIGEYMEENDMCKEAPTPPFFGQ